MPKSEIVPDRFTGAFGAGGAGSGALAAGFGAPKNEKGAGFLPTGAGAGTGAGGGVAFFGAFPKSEMVGDLLTGAGLGAGAGAEVAVFRA